MATFDPDAYLASLTSARVEPAFDPDAYLSSRQNVVAEPRMRFERTNLMPPTDIPAVISYNKRGERLYDGQPARMPVPVDKTQQAIDQQNIFQRALGEAAGVLEVPLAIAGGFPAAIAYGNVPSGSTPEEYAAARQRAEQARLYSPQTPQGRRNLELLGEAFQSELLRPLQGAIGLPLNMLPSGSVAPVNRLIQSEISTAAQPIRNIAEAQKQAKVAQSFQRAPQIDAAKEAARLGIELDPSVSNPTLVTKGISVTTETPKLQARISEDNLPKYANIAKREMGLPENVTLSGMLSADEARAVRQKMGLPPSKTPFADESPFDLALEKVAKPYEEIAKIKRFEPDNAVLNEIESLRSSGLIGSPAQEAAIGKVIDDALVKVSQGTDGQTVISSIADLRKKARKALNSPAATPEQIDLAEVRMKIADSLENLIDANVSDPKLLNRYRQARTDMAKIYGYERATDKVTGLVDVQKIAKELNKNPRLTGDFAALGKIAGVYPESTQMNPPSGRSWQNFTRAGAGGTIGAGLGGAIFGGPGIILGGAAGAGLGQTLSGLSSKLIRSPGYQARFATPTDYRPPVNMLRPAPPSTTENLPVPFDTRNALVGPEYVPNFVFAEPRPQFSLEGQLPQLPPPSAESVLASVAKLNKQERDWQALQEEIAIKKAEAQPRAPTSGGVAFELDPITGRLREVSQGMKGATPETFENYGSSLNSAVSKLSAGRAFDLTADERIAFNKTKVELAEVDPGYAKLTDKQITERMMDRQWVASAIEKARQQAAAFEQIAARAQTEQAKFNAMAQRQRLMDLAESMEEKLRMGRPDTSRKIQGPKTREAKRNKLAPEEQNENALAR